MLDIFLFPLILTPVFFCAPRKLFFFPARETEAPAGMACWPILFLNGINTKNGPWIVGLGG